jgi:hypothetical protein
MRSLPAGIDQRSPARHPDWLGPDDLALKIEEIREATDGQIPIQLKLGAARVYDDVRMAAKTGCDSIYIDLEQKLNTPKETEQEQSFEERFQADQKKPEATLEEVNAILADADIKPIKGQEQPTTEEIVSDLLEFTGLNKDIPAK